jgi:hypothetical protein
MEESYVEGVANHDGPESCVGAREGDGEALTGVRMGRVLGREIRQFGVPTLLSEAEGNTTGAAIARRRATPRGRRPLARAESSCARTGRSPDRPPRMVRRAAPGRPKARSR